MAYHDAVSGHREISQVVLHQGDVLDLSARFFTEEEIGSHFLYVPGGQLSVGGDPTCVAARHRALVDVRDFLMSRYPVTCAEYLSFLRDLARRDADGAAARAPRLRNGGIPLWSTDESGVYQLPRVDGQGLRWDPHWPVMGISFDDAQVYCSGYSARTGVKCDCLRNTNGKRLAAEAMVVFIRGETTLSRPTARWHCRGHRRWKRLDSLRVTVPRTASMTSQDSSVNTATVIFLRPKTRGWPWW